MLWFMTTLIKLRDAVDAMVRVLVLDSDSVVVKLTGEEHTAVLHVITTTRDLGKIIGKRGRTVGALRILVHAASQNIDQVISVDVSAKCMDTASVFIQN
jgi:predicted RNA-binding protein YlqC (UPF0109 family)